MKTPARANDYIKASGLEWACQKISKQDKKLILLYFENPKKRSMQNLKLRNQIISKLHFEYKMPTETVAKTLKLSLRQAQAILSESARVFRNGDFVSLLD